MTITENRAINQITILPAANCINVQWADQILKDGDVISQAFHRKAYSAEQKSEFEAEVDNAQQYVNLITWSQS